MTVNKLKFQRLLPILTFEYPTDGGALIIWSRHTSHGAFRCLCNYLPTDITKMQSEEENEGNCGPMWRMSSMMRSSFLDVLILGTISTLKNYRTHSHTSTSARSSFSTSFWTCDSSGACCKRVSTIYWWRVKWHQMTFLPSAQFTCKRSAKFGIVPTTSM